MLPQDSRWKVAAKPVPYNEGDKVEVRVKGYPEVIRVENKITIKGKPGFIGKDEDSGLTIQYLDEHVTKVIKAKPSYGDSLYERGLPETQQLAFDEVLNNRIDGKTVHEEIRKFLRTVIIRGQETHDFVEKALKSYRANVDQSGGMSVVDLEKAIYKTVIRKHFGDDPFAKMLAHVLATGDYLY